MQRSFRSAAMLFRYAAACLIGAGGLLPLRADEPVNLTPEPAQVTAETLENGWVRWDGIANLEGAMGWRERATALGIDANDRVWVGTSWGRLISKEGDDWTLQAQLPRLQITGIAFDEEKVWLSTSDGIRRLAPAEEPGQVWRLDEWTTYYQGHPAFVSGGYLPGEDARRQWGYVDGLFVPQSDLRAYAPHVISTEHGLFSFASHYGVWHEFWPHYWGANSAWLDLRELIPNRRPTCMTEDAAGHLWIGTAGDGIIRVNASSRRLNERGADDNAVADDAFSRFSPEEIGGAFRRVNDITPGTDGRVWCTFEAPDRAHFIARYDEQSGWQKVELPSLTRKSTRNREVIKTVTWKPTPHGILEVEPGRVLIGVSDYNSKTGVLAYDAGTQTFEQQPQLKYTVNKWVKTSTGELWGLSWWGVYSLPAPAADASTARLDDVPRNDTLKATP